MNGFSDFLRLPSTATHITCLAKVKLCVRVGALVTVMKAYFVMEALGLFHAAKQCTAGLLRKKQDWP